MIIRLRIFVLCCIIALCGSDVADTANKVCGERDRCVPLPECSQLVSMLKNGSTTLEAVDMVREQRCGTQGLNTKVCCPSNGTDIGIRTGKEKKYDDEDDYVDALLEPTVCGFSDVYRPYCDRPIYALYDGLPAYTGISRWMALLGYSDSSILWQCGGTVITTKHVLTAAHCIKRNLYLFRVGQIDYSYNGRYKGSPADYLIKKKIAHEQYSKFHNDIGILVAKETIEFNEYVTPICLPVAVPYEKVKIDPGTGFIEGWGITKNGTASSHLLYSEIHDLDIEKCKETYGKSNVTLDDRVLCAGGEGQDACKGDSGGPLVWTYCINDTDFFYQAGIISYGYDCRQSRFVGVYTNIAHFMPWIEGKVLKKHRKAHN